MTGWQVFTVSAWVWICCSTSGRLLISNDSAAPPNSVFPGQEWEQATPESQGLDGQKLKAAVAHLEANTGGDGSRRLVIIRHGRMVWQGDDIDHVQGIWSCTKTFTSTALGLLIEDGKCSLDTRAADILPAMREFYPEVTLRHFATMTSGYRAIGDEATEGYTHGPSATPFASHPKPLFKPGQAYAYWDSAMNQFAQVLTKIAGEPLDQLIQRRIADPIGMNPAAWKWGTLDEVDGLRINGGSGNKNKHVQISARELARFGLLFLNAGRWSGRQLISQDWVKQATCVQVPATLENAWTKSDIDGPGCYGFNWWCNSMGSDKVMKFPGAPADTFAALGHNNNKLYVIPSWNMVIVRLGLDQAQKKFSDQAQGEFLRLLGLAIQDKAAEPVSFLQTAPAANRKSGTAQIAIGGELKQWHKVTVTLDGPQASELDREPNPFTDYNFAVTFAHESGAPKYTVPGYFAADGNAAESSATAGNKWRAHFSPDAPGKWKYSVAFLKGRGVAVGEVNSGTIANPGSRTQTLAPFHGATGEFAIAPTDKQGRDFRAQGRLAYVGKHYLQFQGTKQYFLKAGPDAPETLLAYADFDGTEPGRKRVARSGEATPNQTLHKYEPHLSDWREGDPTWKGGKGKGLVGALNYLSAKGMNTFSFLPYNSGGDGDNVWPFAERTDKLHYDCSKLDQWGIVFDHATKLGLHLHFKLQEHEIDDNRRGQEGGGEPVPESLDGGTLGVERKLYCRELVARFGHLLALNWNLGEENTQSSDEQRDMIRYIHDIDPYHHNIVIHTFPNWQDRVYTPLLGDQSLLTGASLQNDWDDAHQRTLQWREESAKAGRPWVVANDEQGPASLGVPPDPGYQGHDGIARVRSNNYQKKQAGDQSKQSVLRETRGYTLDDVRKRTLWGTLMAGGAGVEYYFGYQLPQNDLVCEDFRSRDKSWDYCRIALDFFHDNKLPFERMSCKDELVGNENHENTRYCFAIPGEAYVVYLPSGGTTELELSGVNSSTLTVKWFNPRKGGPLLDGTVKSVASSHGKASLGQPPSEANQDWVVLVR